MRQRELSTVQINVVLSNHSMDDNAYGPAIAV
jgi:hypothetical protein